MSYRDLSSAAVAALGPALLVLGLGGCGDDPTLFGGEDDGTAADGDDTSGGGAAAGGAGQTGGAGAGAETSGPFCGDAQCVDGEDCTTCSTDCGDCPCVGPDCEGPACGDGTCDDSEDCGNCAVDCGACGPTCGDLVCEPGEQCDSCPGDCGACNPVCGDGTCSPAENCPADCGCTAHTDCGGDQICYQSSCESAYGRNYLFTVVDASFPAVSPADNLAWDPIGAPDPFVDLCTASACPAQTTTTKVDTHAPTWNETFLVTFNGPNAGSFTFQMWDEDFDAHDFALQTPVGIPSAWVNIVRTQNGSYLYNPNPGLDLLVTIQPQ